MKTIESTIENKLKQLGFDFNVQTSFIKDKLIEIEKIIQEKDANCKSAEQQIKDNKYSLASICKEINISRTSAYNNDEIIKKYIEYSLGISKKYNLLYKLEKSKEIESERKEIIDNMVERDINYSIQEEKIMNLNNRIRELTSENKRLEKEKKELIDEMKFLRKSTMS